MGRTTKPLSDTEIKQAKPKAKEYNLADGNGLYLRVKPNGCQSAPKTFHLSASKTFQSSDLFGRRFYGV